MAAPLTSIEICAGAGGQARGLELAGFDHLALVENDAWACSTLRHNRPEWRVFGPHIGDLALERVGQGDVKSFDATGYRGQVDLLAGGVPCPPFSKAGKQLGADDDRDLFPAAVRLVRECQPRAVMLENVPGLLDAKFDDYRESVERELAPDYVVWWDKVQASDFGVPQLRPRAILVAIEARSAPYFVWPDAEDHRAAPTVGEALGERMAANGWEGAAAWASEQATRIAPTLVGGSKKHGGPDLGPTRAKTQWRQLGVDGLGLADAAPEPGFVGLPRLTVEMTAVLQGFDPAEWHIQGRKTNAYRQVGNAFPPPVAKAFGVRIREALRQEAEPELIVRERAPARNEERFELPAA
ncbi:MAG TPA: DNA cytosine methyltransferase [Thermoleophilaceae bacterium]|nr:DNA cytosine methyltransferase [Thermoleophilaceae bacterium]